MKTKQSEKLMKIKQILRRNETQKTESCLLTQLSALYKHQTSISLTYVCLSLRILVNVYTNI